MTDTSTHVDRYELLPGMSAYQRWRIASVVSTLVLIAGFAPFFGFRDDHLLDGRMAGLYWFLYLIPIPISLVISGLVLRSATRRAKAEGAAGYTTRTSGYTQYDQVNPRTGEVIRRAGSAVLTLPSADGDGAKPTDASDPTTGSPRFTGRSMRRRIMLVSWIGGIVIVLIIAGPVYAAFPHDPLAATIFFFSFVVGLAILVGVVFWAVIAYFRGYLKIARRARPDAFLFLSTLTPELQAAAKSDNVTLPRAGYFAVAVGTQGLELWGRKASLDPIADLPWSSVVRVQPGRLLVSSSNSRSFAAPTLHVFRNLNGEQVDFPLPVFGPKSMAYASPDDANKVLDIVAEYARISDS